MQAATSPARQARLHHRHDLRTLIYVTLEEANGGIVRNLSAHGIAVQAIAAPKPQQNVRVRFELAQPRLGIDARGEVIWSKPTGQCGLRFVDLPPYRAQQINAWIFENLLECAPRFPWAGGANSETDSPDPQDAEMDDGLIVSPAPRNVIQLEPRAAANAAPAPATDLPSLETLPQTDWLSRPLSGRSLAWLVDSLVVLAGLLLFSLVFLAITHELPKWPLETAAGVGLLVGVFYWGFFRLFAGTSLGRWLARLATIGVDGDDAEREAANRFR